MPCIFCGLQENLTDEHVFPAFMGGKLEVKDGSCERCNADFGLAEAALKEALALKAKLSIPDLDQAFRETEKILIELSCLYEGVVGELRFIGGDDYEVALDWIRSAKCTFIENYEKEFKTSWTDTRPRDCSRNLLKME